MTFENHLRSVSTAATQRFGILSKSRWVFHDRSLLGRGFQGFVLHILKYSSAVLCSAADTHLKLLDHIVSSDSFLTGLCLSVTLHIVYLWWYYVSCTRSGVAWCTLIMVLYPSCMCWCMLQVGLWWHIGILMHLLTAELRSTTGLLFPCQCRREDFQSPSHFP